MKLTVSLVVYNGAKYLPFLFESLKKQTFKDFEVVILDNGSSDETVEIAKRFFHSDENQNLSNKEHSKKDPDFRQDDILGCVVEKKENIGFAAGHNEIFKNSNSEYFLVLNQDIYLAPDSLEKLVKFLDENKEVGSVGSKLLKWNFKNCHPEQSEGSSTSPAGSLGMISEIDSLGLKILRSRRVVEIKKISDQVRNDNSMEVFGISGALAMYRRSAINQIGELFDPDFFMYKEDVDLAYRLRKAGWKSYCVLDALAWHDRSGADSGSKNYFNQAKNKRQQSNLIKYYSYRNHLITLYKNEYWQNLLLDFPWILWYELKKFVYFAFFDRVVLLGLKNIWQNRSKIKNQRLVPDRDPGLKIKNLRKLNWKQFRYWL